MPTAKSTTSFCRPFCNYHTRRRGGGGLQSRGWRPEVITSLRTTTKVIRLNQLGPLLVPLGMKKQIGEIASKVVDKLQTRTICILFRMTTRWTGLTDRGSIIVGDKHIPSATRHNAAG